MKRIPPVPKSLSAKAISNNDGRDRGITHFFVTVFFVVAAKIVFFLLQQTLGEIADGIPDGEPAYEDDGEEDDDDVVGMDADRIGVHDKGTAAGAELHEAEGLLKPAEQ